MKYPRNTMIGDEINTADLAPHILEVTGPIPEIPPFRGKNKRDLDSLPVRVRTRYGNRGRCGRRVVSAPTFDLVPHCDIIDELASFNQPRLSCYEGIELPEPIQMKKTRARKRLPPLPEDQQIIPKSQNPVDKRLVSMPAQTLATEGAYKASNDSYTSIIQIYSESSPDGLNYELVGTLDPARQIGASTFHQILPTVVNDLSSQSDVGSLSSESSGSSEEVQNKVKGEITPVKSMVDKVLDMPKRKTYSSTPSSVFSGSKFTEPISSSSSVYSWGQDSLLEQQPRQLKDSTPPSIKRFSYTRKKPSQLEESERVSSQPMLPYNQMRAQ